MSVGLQKIDVERIRSDFPILKIELNSGHPLVYLDSAATSQKPQSVITSMTDYYSSSNANIHRGIYELAEKATSAYEDARRKIADFINATPRSIVFTRNATEAINLVAYSWGREFLKPGDLILSTEMEHHANLLPWQILSEELDLRLEFVPVSEDGLLDQEAFLQLLEQKPRLFAFTQMSNMLGTINPAADLIRAAHQAGTIVLVDGAQSVSHFPVDVQKLDADFLAFSGHKMCGPTGIGVLYARESLLESMRPFLTGGDMIREVEYRSFRTNQIPYKFEAGTPAIAGAIGLGAAVDYLNGTGMAKIHAHEMALTGYAFDQLRDLDGVTIYGPEQGSRGGLVSFGVEGVHPHDVAQILDSSGIAVRAGHHCVMPLHKKYGLSATTRASFYLYNTFEEIDRLVEGIRKVQKIFA